MEKYYTLLELLSMIEKPNLVPSNRLYFDNKEMFNIAHGSSHNHQAWEGGYIGHMTDGMNIIVRLYENLNACRKLDFSLSDALLVFWLHDIEKPWKYGGKPEEVDKYENYQAFQEAKIAEYGFELTDAHCNAIKYAHGEGDDFKKTERVSKPLAAFLHCCDTISARIWFDHPKQKNW